MFWAKFLITPNVVTFAHTCIIAGHVITITYCFQ